MNYYRLIWAPEGKTIATVRATDAKSALNKAPKPYSKYKGEIHVEKVETYRVVVGNLGTVYDGTDVMEAKALFDEYQYNSQFGIGRASGESVTLLITDRGNLVIVQQYDPVVY